MADDEPLMRDSLQGVLNHAGYKVLTAGDGAEALAIFQRRPGEVKLVLTDLMMPLMGGAELIRSLRKLAPTLSIIAFTGFESCGGSR